TGGLAQLLLDDARQGEIRPMPGAQVGSCEDFAVTHIARKTDRDMIIPFEWGNQLDQGRNDILRAAVLGSLDPDALGYEAAFGIHDGGFEARAADINGECISCG